MVGVTGLIPLCIALAAALPANWAREGDLLPRDVTFTTIPATTSYDTTVEQTQVASPTRAPESTGTVNTELESDAGTGVPFPTSVPLTTGTLTPLSTPLQATIIMPTANIADDIFAQPIATDAPPSQISSRDDHPATGVGLSGEGYGPISTNKFYANLFLGSQSQSVWTNPYSLRWMKGGGTDPGSWGMSVSHIEARQFAMPDGDPIRYFVSPIGIAHFIFSATELGKETILTSDSHTAFSVNAALRPNSGADPKISFPMVQGQGFVSALYTDATPLLETVVFFSSLSYVEELKASSSIYKYRITLNDQSVWLMYVTPTGSNGQPPFKLENSGRITGPQGFNGLIQIAKNPAGDEGEEAYDDAAGAYARAATLTGDVNGNTGSYTISWSNGGLQDKELLMFALPHHVSAFDSDTESAVRNIRLQTTTKGMATAILADHMTMVEDDLPTEIGFAPTSGSGSVNIAALNAAAAQAINNAGSAELSQDMHSQCVLNSMYYSGKALAKFATIIYTLNDLSDDKPLAAAGLAKLKEVFDVFVQNKQPFPLVYDTRWKGLVSSASYVTGDVGVDFGNTLYNDHHFHYGYFVYTGAVIGYLDPSWLTQGSNKAWVNALLRDFANPSPEDKVYAHVRSFDWFHGHSWAKGLFESGDGKDQESTSEDTFATFGMKMWGKIIGDPNMEARGNLQLAVQKRSFNDYFLLKSDNKVQPARFIGNKVTGILFENKVDHTTYFGGNTEYIQGIHMIPLSPASSYHRTPTFVREEWDTYFSNGRAEQVQGGWKGILMANYGLIEPKAAWEFFASDSFDQGWLDGGASRTWYLAMAALGGAFA